jgi:GTP:adenosylcobinamide-phosphate guanylyltransferase
MIRGRAEKRTDPAVRLSDYINRVKELEESGPELVYSGDLPVIDGCCHQTVIERCEGCPYATINS